MDVMGAEAVLRSLANRYADAVNRRDWRTFGNCFAPDGRWVVGAPLAFSVEGRADILSHVEERVGSLEVIVQTVGTVVATDCTDGRITGRTTIEEQGRRSEEHGIHILGLYEDELVRLGESWCFASRQLTVLAYDMSAAGYRRPRPAAH